MKKLVNCEHWKEYHGLNGWVMFCSAGAYGKKLSVTEAKSCGCTEQQRSSCKKTMENNVGFGLVPEIYEESHAKGNEINREPALLPGR